MTTTEPAVETAHEARLVTISVNNKPVKMRSHRATGLEIKEAAIEQGVAIDPDFQLAKIRRNGEHKIVGDDEAVKFNNRTKFVATACDDNSET